jgi:hypothetical protein
VTSFKLVRARAEERKGGSRSPRRCCRPSPPRDELNTISDDWVLAEMARRGCSSGIVSALDGREEERHRLFDVGADLAA